MDDDLTLFLESLEAVESLQLVSSNSVFRRPRLYRQRTEDFEKYDDKDFVFRYRLSKETVLFLLEKIEHLLEYKDNRNQSVTPLTQLLCTLRYFATGNFLLTVGDLCGISVATSSRIIKRVANAIVTLRKEFIRFPNSQEEISTVKGQFYKIARFPNVLGCIDCTHVKIQSPDVVARWPGSTHDSTIYQNSQRHRVFESGAYNVAYLLGDSGYPLKSHLLTPYLNPSTHGERKYNEAHIKTRNTVERQYGVLKRRFPVLAVGLRLKLTTSVHVILACCILHNICIIRKEQDPINDGSIPNLEELIQNGQIPPTHNIAADHSYGFQRNYMTQYFGNLTNRN
ncbi:putative nuclease HARBI1 isoform X2 [Bombyx mandarina]|uniref:Nuclease HARBI1 isoform X2 n=1 Tax=Bombyx mandarina TaxID=7092 RepID=A0A6J2KG27_BOMMA|nr:putative nuclease HARBI1 isoform X2 [Bombyx mandarina]